MNKSIIIIAILLITHSVFGQKKPYVIYNAAGKKVSYEKMMKSVVKSDIVLFGELHNNPISHWLQYEVTSDSNADKQLILGAEMLEADSQEILNDYLQNATKEVTLWGNFQVSEK